MGVTHLKVSDFSVGILADFEAVKDKDGEEEDTDKALGGSSRVIVVGVIVVATFLNLDSLCSPHPVQVSPGIEN